MLAKAILFLICSQYVLAEWQKVMEVTHNTHQLQRRGTVYAKLSFGHLKITIKIDELQKNKLLLKQMLAKLKKFAVPQILSQNDQEYLQTELKFLKEIYETKLMEAIELIVEAEEVFKSNFNQKRQLLIGAAALVGGALSGGLAGAISSSTVDDVLKDKQNVLIEQVKANLKIIENHDQNINRLNSTLEVLIKRGKKIDVENAKNEYKLALNFLINLIEVFTQKSKDLINGLQSFKNGKFNLHIANIEDLKSSLELINTNAVKHGYESPTTHILDLTTYPSSFILTRSEIILLTHIPLFHPESAFTLYKYINLPMPTTLRSKQSYLSIKLEKEYIAVANDHTKYLELSQEDLEQCIRKQDTYYCSTNINFKRSHKSCLMALFTNTANEISDYCEIMTDRSTTKITQITSEDYMVNGKAYIFLQCANSSNNMEKEITKPTILKVPRDCVLNGNDFTVSRPKYEISTNLESNLITTTVPINEEWFTGMSEEEVNSLEEEVQQVKVKSSLKGMVNNFKNKLALAELKGRFQFSFSKFLTNLLPSTFMILLVIFILAVIFCIRKSRRNPEVHIEMQPQGPAAPQPPAPAVENQLFN